ncbi:hypothetical protein ACFQMH_41250 [Streptomyces viridiviolaceus]|uniref:Uncharacterized protein n=1 Tax=Streptomyces viridiviolaceus TaxID=68282 RepID=A0ABW2EGZ5_9ACTN
MTYRQNTPSEPGLTTEQCPCAVPTRRPRASPRPPIAPDLGERYLDTTYRTNWLQDVYDDQILAPEQMTATIKTEEPAPRDPDRRAQS